MQTQSLPRAKVGVGIHVFPCRDQQNVDGGPPPAMTITTNRRVNEFAAWYKSLSLSEPGAEYNANGRFGWKPVVRS
jgi:hypothetical protein